MEKNLAAGVVVVVSLICSNPSETKTTRANISAAASSYQPISSRTSLLVLVASLLNLSSRVTISLLRPSSFFWPAKKNGKTEVATLLERFKEKPVETRHAVRVELGLLEEVAAEMFALVVFVSDGLLQIRDTASSPPAARFFSIAAQLPLELQMVLCLRQVGSDKEIILGDESEAAFEELARKHWRSPMEPMPASPPKHLALFFERISSSIFNIFSSFASSVDFSFLSPSFLGLWWSIMLAAVKSGDPRKVAERMRQDPGFNMNMVVDGDRRTLLHHACWGSKDRSAVIPLLLAHPDIDVNLKDVDGWTPFSYACFERLSCVRELLKDSRVNVNEPDDLGQTPLHRTARYGSLDVIQWWIASGREMDLGDPEDFYKMDAISMAKEEGMTEVVTLLERYKENPVEPRHQVRVELGLVDELAAEMFSLVVFVSDELLQINGTTTTTTTPAARFFSIAARLPLELQMMLCFRLVGSDKEIIPGEESEVAFKELARRLW